MVAPLTSDHLQADLRSSLGDGGYIVFGVILFVWELLPTSLVVFFFRVRRPPQERVSPPTCLGHMTLVTTCTPNMLLVTNSLSKSNELLSPNTSETHGDILSLELALN